MKGNGAAPPLSIRLFGQFEVSLSGLPLPSLKFRKSQAVLAFLCLRPGAEVERDWLAGTLWPDTAPSSALHSLRNCLTDLRHALGPEASRLRSPSPRTLALELTGAFVDVAAFDAAIARGDREALETAVSLRRGPLLEASTEAWVLPERQSREQAYLGALEQLAEVALTRGDAAAAERYLRQAVAADPLRESAQRQLMAALAARGNYAAALLAYRELSLQLHRDLHARPDPQTTALFQQLRTESRRLQERLANRSRFSLPAADEPETASGEAPLEASRASPSTLQAQFPPLPGENRLVTVLFADMSRSVETMQHLDPEAAAALVNRLLEVMVGAILRFGGRVDRFLGDGVLAIFGMPRAHEDDAVRAILAARQIHAAAQRLGHPITTGINTGMVYAGAIGPEQHREVTVVGPVVNLASRLQEQASPGQILVGEATYQLARRRFEFSAQWLSAKGIAEPVKAHAVTEALGSGRNVAGSDGGPAPLIGREAELSQLRAALAQTVSPGASDTTGGETLGGQMVSVMGEAGVGKSRLIAELRQAVGLPMQVAWSEPSDPTPHTLSPTPLWLEGRCLELGVTDRYALFVDLFRHYFEWSHEEEEARQVARIDAALQACVGRGVLAMERAREIGPLLAELFSLRWERDHGHEKRKAAAGTTDPEQHRHQTFLAIQDFLLALARQQPLVLVLEDLHWADSLSLDLISLLMESLADGPLLLLCSYRPDQEYRCARLAALAAQKCPARFTELRLRELTPPQSLQLVASLLGAHEPPPAVTALILDRARGNPFFVEELVHSMVARGILYREDRSHAVPAEPSSPNPQANSWRVRERPGPLAVPESVHAVILSRVDRLEPELRRVLQHAAVLGRLFHRWLLEASLDASSPLDGHPASAVEGTLPGSAAQLSALSTALWKLEEQGLIYQERVLPEEEYSFRHVLVQETVYEGILPSLRARLHRQAAMAIERLHGERLDRYYEPLAYHYERSGTDTPTQELALNYLIRAAERAHSTAAHREETARLAQAIAIAERLGRQEQVVELHARRGTALSRIGLWPEARAELETALHDLPMHRTEARAEILIDLAGICFWSVDGPRVRPYAQAGREQAEAAGREDLVGTALAWLAVADQMDGDLRASVRRYREAMERAGGFRTAPVLANAPLTRYLLGEYPEALRLARQAVALIQRLNNTSATMYALSHLGLALAATGRYDEAMTVFEDARRFGVEYEVGHFVARAAAMSAGLHLDVYDLEGNEARAEEAREMARQANFAPTVVSAGIDLLLNYARRGEIGRTEKLEAEVAADAAAVGGWHGWLWELRLTQARAEIALARGAASVARQHAEAAIARSRRRGRVKYEVAGLLTRGQALIARGASRQAVADVRAAVDLARPLGDPALFVRAAGALLALDGEESLAAEARAAAQRILSALPNEKMRHRFAAAEPVRLLGDLDSVPA